MTALQLLDAFLYRLIGPGSIFFWPYLLSAFALSVAYLMVRRRASLVQAFARTFDLRVWWSRTARVDAWFCVVHFGLVVLLSGPVGEFVFQWLAGAFDRFVLPPPFVRGALDLPPMVEMGIVSLIFAVSHDLGAYVTHRLLHSVPILWQIHSVHHSARQLTIFTAHRQHFLEPVVLATGTTIFSVTALATWYFFFPQRMGGFSLFGMSVIAFVMMHIVNLHHFHIPIRFPKWLRAVVVSPHIHHIHHSAAERHIDVNFGVLFSVWDRMFGTYVCEDGELEFGLHGTGDIYRDNYWRAQLLPLQNIVRMLVGRRTTPEVERIEVVENDVSHKGDQSVG